MPKGTKKSIISPAMPFGGMLSALKIFAAALKQKFELPGSANPEDQLKGPIGDLAPPRTRRPLEISWALRK